MDARIVRGDLNSSTRIDASRSVVARPSGCLPAEENGLRSQCERDEAIALPESGG